MVLVPADLVPFPVDSPIIFRLLLHACLIQLSHFLIALNVYTMLVVDVFLGNRFLNLFIDLSNDRTQIVFVLKLQFLVMAAALVRRPFLQDLREAKENLGLSSGFLRQEVRKIIDHKLKIYLVFLIVPFSYSYFSLVDLKTQLLYLVVFRLKALFVRFL